MGTHEPLNIAMLGHKRIPSREGGVEVVVEELATRMAALGHNVVCYNRNGHHISGREHDRETTGNNYKGVKLKRAFTIPHKGLAAMSASVFAAIGAAFGPYDIVHFHAEGPCAMLWLPHLLGKRTVATIHGLDHQRAKWGRFARGYIMLGERVAVRYADEIIVLSEGVRRYFKEIYGRETRYIPNGITRPTRREADQITGLYGLHKDEYILFLGRIVPEKGILYLVEAFRNVRTEKKLVIAGGSSDTEDFVNMLKARAADDRRIIFTGFVEGALLEELYSNAYVYVLPSDLEGMPLSLLEAMSYGNCCLTSDIDECKDVIEDQAMVFRRGDIVDLSGELTTLIDKPGLVDGYRKGAAEFICEKYNWDEVVTSTIALYQNGIHAANEDVIGSMLSQ